jgi:hypothetical protein
LHINEDDSAVGFQAPAPPLLRIGPAALESPELAERVKDLVRSFMAPQGEALWSTDNKPLTVLAQ